MNERITQNDLDHMDAFNQAQAAYERDLYANDDDLLFDRITNEEHEARRTALEAHLTESIRLIDEKYGRNRAKNKSVRP